MCSSPFGERPAASQGRTWPAIWPPSPATRPSWLRARRPPEEDLEDVVLPGPDTAAGPVFQREQRSLLAEALRQLGEPDEAIFRLHYQQGCSAQQIARQLGMPGATVRTRLFRGRRKLKQYFEERGIGYEELL